MTKARKDLAMVKRCHDMPDRRFLDYKEKNGWLMEMTERALFTHSDGFPLGLGPAVHSGQDGPGGYLSTEMISLLPRCRDRPLYTKLLHTYEAYTRKKGDRILNKDKPTCRHKSHKPGKRTGGCLISFARMDFAMHRSLSRIMRVATSLLRSSHATWSKLPKWLSMISLVHWWTTVWTSAPTTSSTPCLLLTAITGETTWHVLDRSIYILLCPADRKGEE